MPKLVGPSRMRQLMKNSGLIFVLVLAGCSRYTDPPVGTAHSCLAQLQLRVLKFYLLYGRYPTNEEGLECMIQKPHDWAFEREWKRLIDRPELLIDPWGRKYKYLLHPELKYGFVVYTISAKGLFHSLETERYPTSSIVKLLPESERALMRRYKRAPAENMKRIQLTGLIVGTVAVSGVLFYLSRMRGRIRRGK